jgi:hypothetical protein
MTPRSTVSSHVKHICLPRIARSETRACSRCAQHRALYRFRNRVRRDRDHDLCFRCYRSLYDHLTSQRAA